MRGACFSRILIMFIMILFWLSILESHIHQISKLSMSYNQLYLLTIKRHLSINFLVFIFKIFSSIRCILNTLICIQNGKLSQLKKKILEKIEQSIFENATFYITRMSIWNIWKLLPPGMWTLSGKEPLPSHQWKLFKRMFTRIQRRTMQTSYVFKVL